MPIAVSGSNIVFADGSSIASGFTGFKNRIINGAMVIDQRNAGASVTPTTSGSYTLDRWQVYNSQSSKFSVQQNAGSVTPPAAFSNYLGATSLSAYSITSGDYFTIGQPIEGFNVADLNWGTANAKTITISFWVRSSLTGTFGACVTNSAFDRSYPFSYTINSANTWEYETITIAGDISGTWLTNNGRGIELDFGIGVGSSNSGTAGSWQSGWKPSVTSAVSVVGTNGATFYITGVQLEVGSSATSFDYRDYGNELRMCQRYYEKSYNISTVPGTAPMDTGSSNLNPGTVGSAEYTSLLFKVPKRTTPTITIYNDNTGASGQIRVFNGSGFAGHFSTNIDLISENSYRIAVSRTNDTLFIFHWVSSAEL
jgi:hypothetical protein